MSALVTAEELMAYLPQVGSTGDDLSVLDECIARASGMVEGALGFTFTDYPAEASALTLYGQGLPSFYLPPHQAASVTKVTLAGDTTEITGWTEDTNGSLYIGGGWVDGQRYSVTAKWGTGPVPDAVKQVTLECAVNIYRGRDRGMWQEVLGSEGGANLRFTGGMTSQQRAIIDAVRAQYTTPYPGGVL